MVYGTFLYCLKYLNLQQLLVATEFELQFRQVSWWRSMPRETYWTYILYKVSSIGNYLAKAPITYQHLKVIELYQVSFEDMKEILVVLRLIENSPNLQELHISTSSKYVDLKALSSAVEQSSLRPKVQTARRLQQSSLQQELVYIVDTSRKAV
ncbi:hypothetical protein OROMI_023935 [Orobanche minor]